MKKEIKICILLGLVLIICLSTIIYGILKIINQKKSIDNLENIIVNIETAVSEENKSTKYDFIDYDIAVYIENLSVGLKIKPELAFFNSYG